MRHPYLLLPVWLCAWLLAAPTRAEPVTGPGQPWGIRELMLELRQVKSASGQFVERKTLSMLSEPLVASGTLLYVAPDQLQKITVLPKRERIAISGDTLSIAQGPEEQTRTLSLTSYPEVGAFVEGIRATLAGDLATLSRFYALRLDGSAADWQLLLQPRDARQQQLVKWIRIAGNGNRMTKVETEETDGDHSEMSIVEDVR